VQRPSLQHTATSSGRAEWPLRVVAWFALALALAAAYSRIGGDTFLSRQLFNADVLYLPALYQDLATNTPLNGWQLTPAPYFFPDMPVYFGLHFLTGEPRTALLLFGIVQTIALTLGLWYVAYQLHLPRITSALLVFSTALFVVAASRAYVPFTFSIFQPTTHFGTMVVAVFVFGLVLKRLSSDSPVLAALLVGLSAAAAASDSLYLVQLVAPAVISLFLLGFVRAASWRRLASIALALLSGSALGLFLGMQVASNTALASYVTFDAGNIVRGVGELYAWLVLVDPNRTPAVVAVTLFLVLSTVLAGRACRQHRRGTVSAPRLLALVFVPVAAGINLAAVVFSGRADFERYIIPVMVLGCCFGWAMLAAAGYQIASGQAQQAVRRVLLVALFSFLALAISNTSTPNLARLVHYYPALVRCLDSEMTARNLRYGIANYWQAKFISVLSHAQIRVVQVTPELEPFYWINNRAWYDHDVAFIIIDETSTGWHRLDRAAIIGRFGEPAETVRCDTNEVLIYTTPAFRTQFRKADALP